MDRTKETREVVERIALELETDGLPRIAGRVLGLLLLSPEALCLDDIAQDLLISKASASTNARLLERLGVLERTSHPGDRRDFYRISPEAHMRILGRRVDRLQALLRVIEEARSSSAAETPSVCVRLASISRFFQHMIDVVRSARRRWEEEDREHTRPEAPVRADR